MKKGFTLTELLGVIVIIGLLLLLIIPLIINGVKNKEGDVTETRDNIIFESVGEFLDLDKEKYPNMPGSVYCIKLKELKDAGVLVDPVKKIVEDGDFDDDYTIEVIITKEGTRKFNISDENCKAYKSKNIEMVINPSNSKWSKEKEVTIYYPEECGKEYTCTYKKDNGEVQTVTSGNSVKVKYDKNGTIQANMVGKSEIEKKQKVEKIDIENPYIVKLDLVTPWTMDYKQQINITLTDKHSGVGGYCILTEKEFKSSQYNSKRPKADDKCFTKVRFPAYGGIGTVTEFLPQDKYYIFVKDRVGNVGGYNPENPNDPDNKKSTFEVKDTTPPTCTITAHGTLGSNGWYISDTTVKVNPSDNYSGVRKYDITLSANPTYNNVSQLLLNQDTYGTAYYGYVEDRAGNKNKCNLTVKRDAAVPSCSLSKSNINTSSGVTLTANCSVGISGQASCSGTRYGATEGTYYCNVTNGAGVSNSNYNTVEKRCSKTKCTEYYCTGYEKICTIWCCTEAGTGVDKCSSSYITCGGSADHSGAPVCGGYKDGDCNSWGSCKTSVCTAWQYY